MTWGIFSLRVGTNHGNGNWMPWKSHSWCSVRKQNEHCSSIHVACFTRVISFSNHQSSSHRLEAMRRISVLRKSRNTQHFLISNSSLGVPDYVEVSSLICSTITSYDRYGGPIIEQDNRNLVSKTKNPFLFCVPKRIRKWVRRKDDNRMVMCEEKVDVRSKKGHVNDFLRFLNQEDDTEPRLSAKVTSYMVGNFSDTGAWSKLDIWYEAGLPVVIIGTISGVLCAAYFYL